MRLRLELLLAAVSLSAQAKTCLVVWDPIAFGVPAFSEMSNFVNTRPDCQFTFRPALPGLADDVVTADKALSVLDSKDFANGTLSSNVRLLKEDLSAWIEKQPKGSFDQMLVVAHGSQGHIHADTELPFGDSLKMATLLTQSKVLTPEIVAMAFKDEDPDAVAKAVGDLFRAQGAAEVPNKCKSQAGAFIAAKNKYEPFKENDSKVSKDKEPSPPKDRIFAQYMAAEEKLHKLRDNSLKAYKKRPSPQKLKDFCQLEEGYHEAYINRAKVAQREMKIIKPTRAADKAYCLAQSNMMETKEALKVCLLELFEPAYDLSKTSLLSLLKPQSKADVLACQFGNQGVSQLLASDIQPLESTCSDEMAVLKEHLKVLNHKTVDHSLKSFCSQASEGVVFSAAELSTETSMPVVDALDKVDSPADSVEEKDPELSPEDDVSQKCADLGLAGKFTLSALATDYFGKKKRPLGRSQLQALSCKGSALTKEELDSIGYTLGSLANLMWENRFHALSDVLAPLGYYPYGTENTENKAMDRFTLFYTGLYQSFGPGKLKPADAGKAIEAAFTLNDELKRNLASLSCYQCINKSAQPVSCDQKIGNSSFNGEYGVMFSTFPTRAVIALRDTVGTKDELAKATQAVSDALYDQLPDPHRWKDTLCAVPTAKTGHSSK